MQKTQILSKYFWDTDVKNIDLKNNSKQVIERILEYGDEKTIHWLFSFYSASEIKKVARKSRRLSNKSANFWKEVLSASQNTSFKKRTLCTKKQ